MNTQRLNRQASLKEGNGSIITTVSRESSGSYHCSITQG